MTAGPAPLALDPDRALALAYVPAGLRAAVAALWALDLRMADIVRTTHEPVLGTIKLAWWRDALAALDTGRPPDEPLLIRLAGTAITAGVRGATIAAVPGGWAPLLDADGIDAGGLATIGRERGGVLFAAIGALLDPGAGDGTPAAETLAAAGAGWALADLGNGVSDRTLAAAALDAAREPLARALAARWPRALRPLGMLATLAATDVAAGGRAAPPGSPRRAWRMARHRMTGR